MSRWHATYLFSVRFFVYWKCEEKALKMEQEDVLETQKQARIHGGKLPPPFQRKLKNKGQQLQHAKE
jgi:hypothetical protein